MKRILLCVLITSLLISCIGMESNIRLNSNGSGILIFKYRLSLIFLNMGKTDEESITTEAPLPTSEENFKKSLEGVDGLRLKSIQQEETERDLIITAEIEFDSVDALAQSSMFDDRPISLVKEGQNYIFTQLITNGSETLDENNMEMLEAMFQGYELSFSITAPKRIKTSNIGDISADRRTVTYSLSISELIKIKEKTELIVKW